jgi:hypothetical protein
MKPVPFRYFSLNGEARLCYKLTYIYIYIQLHNEELHNLYTSPNIIRMIKSRRLRWDGSVARMGRRNAYRILVGKPEGKRPLGRPRRRWVDNLKMDLRDRMGCYKLD